MVFPVSVAALSVRWTEGLDDTPVSKVIKLIEDLKKQIEEQGKEEAKTYDEFACFCKDGTESKSDSIKELYSDIDELTAEISDKTAHIAETLSTIEETKKTMEGDQVQMHTKKNNCLKWETEYEASAQELSHAIDSVDGAIEILEKSKPPAAALLQSVNESLALAEALGLVASAKVKSVSAFLQHGGKVDPSDPEYKFHSQGIIEVLEKLKKEFTSHKSEMDAEWEKTDASCKDIIKNLQTQIEEAAKVIKDDTEMAEELKETVAKAKENLVTSEGLLKDDQLYLKDLTLKCEDAGKDWDNRVTLRTEELQVLSHALEVLQEEFMDVLKPKLLLQKAKAVQGTASGIHEAEGTETSGRETAKKAHANSFLEIDSKTPRARGLRLLEKVVPSELQVAAAHAAEFQVRQAKVASFLTTEARRIKSQALASFAGTLSGSTELGAAEDPFKKVKDLIQGLLERLLKEAAEEATKKGFCAVEIGKVTMDRDARLADVKKLNTQVAALETSKSELTAHVEMLTEAMAEIEDALKSNAKIRTEDKAQNLKDIEMAKEGLPAIKNAISILKDYYKKAGKSFLQASPVDEDTAGTGFKKYEGKQEGATGIIGLLEVIQSDFEKTLEMTTAAEAKSAAEFVEFERSAKVDLAGKEMTKTLDKQDIEFATISIEKKMDDLKMNMKLVDTANLEYQELVPMCLDTGMSYSERVAKREEEMEALKKALCLLDPEGVEKDCK